MKRIGYWWFCVRLWFRERPDKIAWWVALKLPRRWALMTFVRVFSAGMDDSPETMKTYCRLYERWRVEFGSPRLIQGWLLAANSEAPFPPDIWDAAEMLWIVLANVSGGDWLKQPDDWRLYAAKWRDYYHEAVRTRQYQQQTALGTPQTEGQNRKVNH